MASDTQERILEAAHQLQYIPADGAQRAQSEMRATNNVGLVLGQVAYKFSDPFWAPVLDGVDEELTRQGYHLAFAFSIDDLKHGRNRRRLSRTQIDGLILAAGIRPFGENIGRERSVVVEGADVMRWESPLIADVVALEKRRAMYRIVDHLVGLGRRRIGFLGPPAHLDERAEAFIQGMARHELRLDPELFVRSPWSTEGAYLLARDLLAAHGSRLDALVCACDTIAIGAMRAAKDYGLRLPDDLAITGFDDIAFARDLDPPLTTVHVPTRLLGNLAARRLIDRMAQPDLPPIILTVPTTLIIRASCGAQGTALYDRGREGVVAGTA